jgi:hypothetical protein
MMLEPQRPVPNDALALPSMFEQFDETIRAASESAIAAHGAAGRTIPIWRDGKVIYISAEELLHKPQPSL